MSAIDIVFYIAILVMSIVVHEVSHGFMAEYFGDKTARYAGRLTLNPIKHLDPFGSIFLPVILALSGANFLFGWAKPVPYNPDNLSNKKWGTVAVAAAGVLSNLLIAVLFGLLFRLSPFLNPPSGFYTIVPSIILINLALAIFNLVPIPPLDGSKILFSFLPQSLFKLVLFIEQYSLILLIIFIVFFSDYLYPILAYAFKLIAGLSL
ncbi:MAG: site-2 protease family protein [bacterium]|nr:site-2 protease family protein [bacterium]